MTEEQNKRFEIILRKKLKGYIDMEYSDENINRMAHEIDRELKKHDLGQDINANN